MGVLTVVKFSLIILSLWFFYKENQAAQKAVESVDTPDTPAEEIGMA